jgi:hypothetical protein
MPSDIVFREHQEEVEEPEAPQEQRETPNLIEGREDGAVKDKDAIEEIEKPSPLEEWEIKNGKYGLEFFNIKEIAGEFPLKMQFSAVDKYIKGLLQEGGLKMTPGRYQETIDAIEKEIGSAKLGVYERMKKLSEYVKIISKMDDLKKKRESLRQ